MAFCAPGGKTPVIGWDYPEYYLAQVTFKAEEVERNPKAPRWEKAQKAEINFWRKWRKNILYKNITPDTDWAEVLKRTGGPLPAGKVLDIGCGPISVLNFFRGDGMRPIGIDPLAELYAREQIVEWKKGWEPITMVSLSAEKLPFANEYMDHLICFNVLDHVADAVAMLKEMLRVLRPGGTIRIYIHTFSRWLKKLLFFDSPHLSHWEHIEFSKLLESSGLEIIQENIESALFFELPSGFYATLRYFSYWIASKAVKTSYFLLKKPNG